VAEANGASPSVLQVVTSSDRRGAEVAAVQLERALQARGVDIDTVALWPGRGAAALDLRALGSARRDPRAIRALARAAKDHGVVLGQGSSTLPFGAVASTLARVPFVYRSIGDPSFWAASTTRRTRVRAALSRARLVVAIWPGAADVFVDRYGIDPARLRVIPNGVPADAFEPTAPAARAAARRALADATDAPIDADRPLVAYLGALSHEKHPLLAVEAAARMPEVQLVLAGQGPLAGDVAVRADAVGGGRILAVGPLAEPAALLAAADALVLPSRSEGIPAVVIEAGMAGLPVVASDVGGVREVVVDGETGRVVATRSPAAFADALRSVLGPPGDELGRAARARCVERFSLDVVADQWEPLLAEAAGSLAPR
jgi:glycosyltransferase involved in cell wall biosynthesis